MTDAVKPLGFKLEQRGGTWILVYDSGGCHPATDEEIALWNLRTPPAGWHPIEDYPEVYKFAEAMLFKLRKNADKDGSGWAREHGMRSWKSCDPSFLMGKLREELAEFKVELIRVRREYKTANDTKLLHEAADVANIVMMLVDNCGTLTPAAPENET